MRSRSCGFFWKKIIHRKGVCSMDSRLLTPWYTNYTGRNMGASLWPRDKSSVEAMVTFWLATSEEGTCPTLSRQSHDVLGSARSSDDGHLGEGYQNQWGILCITSDEIAKFHQKREAWYANHRCSTPAGQCSSSQLTCCPDRSAILRLCNPSFPLRTLST